MGMAASQARLLSLTSRLHDVELRAQAIEAQKIALATQQDELYQNYCDALDATKFQVAFMGADGSGKSWEKASFKNLCTFMGKERWQDYALRDNRTGLLVETQEVVDNYNLYNGDKYAFAWAMLGFDNMDKTMMNVGTSGDATKYWKDGFQLERCHKNDGVPDGGSSIMSETEWNIYDNLSASEKEPLEKLYQNIEDAVTEGDESKRDEAVAAFRKKLYETPGMQSALMESMGAKEDQTWKDIVDEFNFYCRKFEAIQQAGGCTAIDPQFETGTNGENWLKNMVEAGLITILANNEPKGASANWKDTSVATSTNGNYLSEVQDDKDLKKAEAEYEHELRIINNKDKKFDTDLSKLETERTSITTEMDAIKTVRDDNIDRTFGIFS